jgi:hypothetical protein
MPRDHRMAAAHQFREYANEIITTVSHHTFETSQDSHYYLQIRVQ